MILPKRLLYTSYLHLICRLVIETLEGVEKDRKCFRMVGGVLVERKVGEVEPALTSNRDKVRFFGKTSVLEEGFIVQENDRPKANITIKMILDG